MKKEVILIVEDRETDRALLEMIVRVRGGTVLTAANGEEALAIAQRTRPDLVITDVVMPRMDGYELVRRLREAVDLRDVKVIFYTASFLEEDSRELALQAGVPRLIPKPAEPEEILRAIDEVLGARIQSVPPPRHEEFSDRHRRLLTDKLSEKVDELERLNAELESRVEQRTAELLEANARLEQRDQVRNRFLAIVSHDLRSPLHGIVMAAEMLAKQASQAEPGATPALQGIDRTTLLYQIANSASEQIQIVNDLLELARCESDPAKLHLSPVALGELVTEAVRALGLQARLKGIQLAVAPANENTTLNADRARLSHLLSNLLDNAIKFTRPGGSVRAHARDDGGEVELVVEDSGIGFPSPDPRSPGGTILKRRGTAGEFGTGLGLAIIRQIVASHGGSVDFMPVPTGGTSVHVRLPKLHPSRPVSTHAGLRA